MADRLRLRLLPQLNGGLSVNWIEKVLWYGRHGSEAAFYHKDKYHLGGVDMGRNIIYVRIDVLGVVAVCTT